MTKWSIFPYLTRFRSCAKTIGPLWLVVCVLFATAISAFSQSKTDLTISAAISLQDALNAVSAAYRSSHSGAMIHLNLGASGTLQRQIEQGAPVDIFISASPKEMDSLESKGLILAGTRKDLARNTVVLIVPAAGNSPVSSFQKLTDSALKHIAIGEPNTVPAGAYAQQVLTHFGIWDQLKPKMVFGNNVRQVLQYVETNNADAGIVYATDASITKQVRVVATAPEDSHSPVVYPVAVIKSSHDPSAAKDLIQFLLGSRAQAILEKYGFSPAAK